MFEGNIRGKGARSAPVGPAMDAPSTWRNVYYIAHGTM